MKRFHFRLKRVLQLKQQKERQLELRQRQARLFLEAAQTEAALVRDRLAEHAAALESRIGETTPPDSWIARYQYLAQLNQSLEKAEERVRIAAQRMQEATAMRARIATEVEVLDCLRTRQWREHQKEAMWDEQQRLDELVLERWNSAVGNVGLGIPVEEGDSP